MHLYSQYPLPSPRQAATSHRTTFSLRTVLVVSLAVLIPLPLLSHSRLVTPSPRTSSDPSTQSTLDSGGLNFSFPCGPVDLIPPGAPTATWMAGEDYTVTFDHRVDHGGELIQFLVSYDGGMTFDDLEAPAQAMTGTTSYVQGGIPAPPGTGLENIRLKSPTTPAASVVLRFTDGTYFSCADITISGAGGSISSDGFETGDISGWDTP